MNQELITGLVGLAGAGIGGAGAVWGAAIGGRRTVEAAERQAQRTAAAEHQHWQRQERAEAYQELMAAAEPLTKWGTSVPWETARLSIDRVEKAIRWVTMLGPHEAGDAVTLFHRPIGRAEMASWALQDLTDPCPPRPGGPVDVAGRPDLQWLHRHQEEFRRAFDTFAEQVRQILDRPPA